MIEHLAQMYAVVYRFLRFYSVLCWKVHDRADLVGQNTPPSEAGV
jgi:hypothetical protein